MTATVIVNGEIDDQISVYDRGLAYGDGLFETILCVDGNLLLWEQHLERLDNALTKLHIRPYDSGGLLSLIQPYLSMSGEQIIKIIVTRGVSQRGYSVPDTATANTIIYISDKETITPDWSVTGITVKFCETRLAYQPELAGLKHLNRLEQVLAQMEFANSDCQEGIMLGYEGEVVEATRHNLFLVKNGGLLTPDLTDCGVMGVMRAFIIECARELTVPVSIGRITVSQLLQADEIFLTNSINGIWPICELDGTRMATGEVTCLLMDKVAELFYPHD